MTSDSQRKFPADWRVRRLAWLATVAIAFLLFFRARWAFYGSGYDQSCYVEYLHRLMGLAYPACYSHSHFPGIALMWLPFGVAGWIAAHLGSGALEAWLEPLVGVSSFAFWAASLAVLWLIGDEYRKQSARPFLTGGGWALLLLLNVPLMFYAFEDTFRPHAGEWLLSLGVVLCLLRRRYFAALLLCAWLSTLRLNDVPIVLMVLGKYYDDHRAQPALSGRAATAFWVLTGVLLALGAVPIYRIAFVTGYHHILLADILRNVTWAGLWRVLATPHLGMLWFTPAWCLIFALATAAWRRLSWMGRAGLVWMALVLVFHVGHAIWWGGSPQQIRYLIGTFAAVWVLAMELGPSLSPSVRAFTAAVIAGEAIWSTAFYWASGDTIVWLQLLQGHWGKGYVSHDGSSIPVAWRMLVVEPIGASPIPFSLFSTFCASAWLDRFASFRVYALSGPRLGVLAVLSAAAAGVAGFAAFRLRAAWRELRAEGRSRGPSADPDAIRAVLAERERLGDAFPRFGILVVAYRASRRLPETLRRIPPALLDAIAEIFVFDELSDDETIARAERLLGEAPWKSKLRFYRNPQRHGYGGNQKVGFDYAIDRGLSHVILLHGDGEFAPERLAEMMLPVLRARASVVLGSRMKDPIAALGMGMPLYKWLSNRLLSGWQRFFLGMELSEFHCGYRLYATEVLQRLPYRANSDGYLFDTQMIIQCRALAVPITEVAVPAGSGGEIGLANGIRYAFQALGATIEYRLHQLHLVRHGRYLVDRDVRYQLKRSPFSSHGQILSRIRPGSAVLDVGCGPGLLAHQMTARGAKVVGVDILARDKVWPGLEEYHRVDLEKSGELLPTRQFDYVVLADVVEHVRNPQELLRGISKFLKPDGRLLLSSGNIAIWFYRLSLLAGRFHYGPRGILDETHVHLYTRSTLRHLLLTSGYRISAIRYTGLPFEVVFESTGGSALVRLVDRIYYALVRLWPKLFAYQFVIEARVEALEAARGEGRLLQSHDRDRRVA